MPALDSSILQQVRELGRRPVEYNNPANEEQRREGALACKIRKNMSKLTGATKSVLESFWHEYGWAQEVQQMRARMLQDGNLPGGDAPTRRELLRRLELMSAARPLDVLLMERHGPQAGATKRRVTDWWRNAGIALRFRAPAWCGGGRFTIPVAAIHYDLSHQLLLDAEAFLSGVSPPAHAKQLYNVFFRHVPFA